MDPAARTAPALEQLERARAQLTRTVRRLNLMSPVLVITVPLVSWYADPRPGLHGARLVLSIALGLFVVGVIGRNATSGDRRRPVHLVFVAALTLASVLMVVVQPTGPGNECLRLAVLCIAVVLRGRASVVVVVAGFALAFVVTGFTDRTVLAFLALVMFALLYGLLFLAYRLAAANDRAARLLAELEAGEQSRAEAIGIAERQRLAREMHDVLAHSLSGLLLQLEGARMMANEAGTAPALRDAVERAHRLGRLGLDEARRAIGTLRDDDLPGPERLGELVDRFEHDQRVPCALTVRGPERTLPAEARLTVYRVAQESLTNIVKHASDRDHVEIELAYDAAAVRLVVEDFGTASPAAVSALPALSAPPTTDGSDTLAHGYGLIGMQERAGLLGGTLDARPTTGGFRVELCIPAVPADEVMAS